MCNKASNIYPSAMKLILKCLKTQKLCNRAADICPLVFYSNLDRYETRPFLMKKRDFYAKILA